MNFFPVPLLEDPDYAALIGGLEHGATTGNVITLPRDPIEITSLTVLNQNLPNVELLQLNTKIIMSRHNTNTRRFCKVQQIRHIDLTTTEYTFTGLTTEERHGDLDVHLFIAPNDVHINRIINIPFDRYFVENDNPHRPCIYINGDIDTLPVFNAIRNDFMFKLVFNTITPIGSAEFEKYDVNPRLFERHSLINLKTMQGVQTQQTDEILAVTRPILPGSARDLTFSSFAPNVLTIMQTLSGMPNNHIILIKYDTNIFYAIVSAVHTNGINTDGTATITLDYTIMANINDDEWYNDHPIETPIFAFIDVDNVSITNTIVVRHGNTMTDRGWFTIYRNPTYNRHNILYQGSLYCLRHMQRTTDNIQYRLGPYDPTALVNPLILMQ